MNDLLSASGRVAFAALIHDLGKLAQRAKLPISVEQSTSPNLPLPPYSQCNAMQCNAMQLN